MNELLTRLFNLIERQEKLYFRTIIILMIVFLFLAAERFQDLVVFVSIGLVAGALYYRWKGGLVDIGAFIGACLGFLLYGAYFILTGLVTLA